MNTTSRMNPHFKLNGTYMHKKEGSVKESSNYDHRRELDRIEGNRIIIHDHYPNRFMKLNEIVIITATET